MQRESQEEFCSGQVKTDSALSGREPALRVIRTDIAPGRVQPRAVVAPLEGLDHLRLRFLPGSLLARPGPFPFATPEEPRSARLIATGPLPAQTPAHARCGEQPLVRRTGLLTPVL
jgi:hypothetical protein